MRIRDSGYCRGIIAEFASGWSKRVNDQHFETSKEIRQE